MITRSTLSKYLHDFLNCALYKDYAPNGIQIEGKDNILRICTAVTASAQAISCAIEWQADALLVHHGYFWRGEELILAGMKRARIQALLTHNINLFAYHLPLDCHPKIGNNACLAQLLDLKSIQMHARDTTENLLWSGILAKPTDSLLFSKFLEQRLHRAPLHISGTKKMINSIALCTGAAQDFIEQAHHLGVDAYLSGEISERTYYQAKELDIHYYSCGHHATERYGIQSLGRHLSLRFKLEHLYIESDNPV